MVVLNTNLCLAPNRWCCCPAPLTDITASLAGTEGCAAAAVEVHGVICRITECIPVNGADVNYFAFVVSIYAFIENGAV